jgi:hypothetical protein
MEITKEQVLEIYNMSQSEAIRRYLKFNFREAFKVELKVDKIYKYKNGTCIVKVTELQNKDFGGYGFNHLGEYVLVKTGWTNTHEGWQEANTEEWESALIEEAKKRGYKKGLSIQDIYNGNSDEDLVNVSSDLFDYESIKAGVNQGKMALRDSEGSVIFYDGVWAEIVKTFSKEEAEKLLGGKII